MCEATCSLAGASSLDGHEQACTFFARPSSLMRFVTAILTCFVRLSSEVLAVSLAIC